MNEERRHRITAARAAGTAAAAELHATAAEQYPDPLEHLAFIAGTIRTKTKDGLLPPFNYRLYSAELEARNDERPWADIAVALGIQGDGADRLARRRHEARAKLLADNRRANGVEER